YLKFPYLKSPGWKGHVDGADSGVYRAAPLARLNVADGMATPLAHEQYERMMATLGGSPVHFTLAYHWARVIELVQAAEAAYELARDPEITDPNIRTVPTETPTEGVGVIEAPRGILFHHYKTDEDGIVEKANLIVGTTNNYAAINLSIGKAAKAILEDRREVTEGALNMVEMAFRAYDPCFGCATHSLPGQMPMEVTLYDSGGEVISRRVRD
ncbi:nickel-dependent hydrogenase large subunit, partial [bacterium]|nr:nickel-dependent hydrogenase large subunit [bacterium]